MEPKLVMYQEVPYSTDGVICFTPCPFGEKYLGAINFVGAGSCSMCRYFEERNEGERIVKCTHKVEE